MAIDAYNWHTCRGCTTQNNPWRSLEEIIRPFRDFGAAHPTQELWLAEWATSEDPDEPGRKAEWISDVKGLFSQPEYSQFAAISYCHREGTGSASDCSWPINSSPSAEAAFATLATDPLFAGEPFSVDPGPDPEPNQPPPDLFPEPACTDLSCSFDATGSTDEDGTISDHEWGCGDGNTSTQPKTTHTYVTAGTYTVTLRITDNDGATDSTSRDVTVTDPAPSQLILIGSEVANMNTTTLDVPTPVGTQTDDLMVLFVTGNRSDATLTVPEGWTSLGHETDQTMQSSAWWRHVDSTAPGVTTVMASLGTKIDAQVLVYRGVDGADPIVGAAVAPELGSGNDHATPGVAGQEGGVVISYWADKTSSSTS